MTDNSTTKAESTSREERSRQYEKTVNNNIIVLSAEAQNQLKARIDELHIPWGDEYATEVLRLGGQLSMIESDLFARHEPPLLQEQEAKKRAAEILLEWTPSFSLCWGDAPRPGELFGQIPLDIITAFREEFAYVLNDRGAQLSLFEETNNAPKLTAAQSKVWANYYKLSPDARRFWLLAAASYLKGILNTLNEQLALTRAETVPAPFAGLFTMQALNELGTITPHTKREIDRVSDKKTISVNRGRGDTTTVVMFDLNTITEVLADIRTSTIKLLDYASHKLTLNNEHKRLSTRTEKDIQTFNTFQPKLEVKIPINEYAELLGIKATTDNLKYYAGEWEKDLMRLKAATIDGRWADGSFINCDIFSDVAIKTGKNGYIYIAFGLNFARYLIGSFVTYMPRAMFALDNRKPILYHICRRLVVHYGMDSNRIHGTYNIISVRALLDACDEIPDYKDISRAIRDNNKDRGKDRHITARTINPLTEALDVLAERGIITWEYTNAKGAPLSDNQCGQLYENLIDAYVKFEIIGHPDPTPRLEKKAGVKTEVEKKKTARKQTRSAKTATAAKPKKVTKSTE